MLKALQTKQLATPIHLLCTSILILLKKTPADTACRKQHQVNNCPLFVKKLNKENNLTDDQ